MLRQSGATLRLQGGAGRSCRWAGQTNSGRGRSTWREGHTEHQTKPRKGRREKHKGLRPQHVGILWNCSKMVLRIRKCRHSLHQCSEVGTLPLRTSMTTWSVYSATSCEVMSLDSIKSTKSMCSVKYAVPNFITSWTNSFRQ